MHLRISDELLTTLLHWFFLVCDILLCKNNIWQTNCVPQLNLFKHVHSSFSLSLSLFLFPSLSLFLSLSPPSPSLSFSLLSLFLSLPLPLSLFLPPSLALPLYLCFGNPSIFSNPPTLPSHNLGLWKDINLSICSSCPNTSHRSTVAPSPLLAIL